MPKTRVDVQNKRGDMEKNTRRHVKKLRADAKNHCRDGRTICAERVQYKSEVPIRTVDFKVTKLKKDPPTCQKYVRT